MIMTANVNQQTSNPSEEILETDYNFIYHSNPGISTGNKVAHIVAII